MYAMRMFATPFFVALIAALVSGCSDGRPPKAPMPGRLTLQGKPLTNVVVNIVPEDLSFGAYGLPDEDGYFRVVSSNGDDGVVLGTHKVFVGELEKNVENPVLPKLLGAERMRYASYEKTDMTVDVKKGQNELVIDLK